MRQVTQARDQSDAEFKKRCSLERALQEAAAVFKKELWMKQEEMSRVQGELQGFKDWHARASARLEGERGYLPPPGPSAADLELRNRRNRRERDNVRPQAPAVLRPDRGPVCVLCCVRVRVRVCICMRRRCGKGQS